MSKNKHKHCDSCMKITEHEPVFFIVSEKWCCVECGNMKDPLGVEQ